MHKSGLGRKSGGRGGRGKCKPLPSWWVYNRHMTTDLPPPGASSEQDHVKMSRRFLDHATKELDNRNRLQASEKVWGAVSHALKAVGERRGWDHKAHLNLLDMSAHLGKEFDQAGRFDLLTDSANGMHTNFYENDFGEDRIRRSIEFAKEFVDRLDQVRTSPPRPFTIETADDQRHLARLLRISPEDAEDRLPMGTYDPKGFSRNPEDGGGWANSRPGRGRPPVGPRPRTGSAVPPGDDPVGAAGQPSQGVEPGAGRQRRTRGSMGKLARPKPAFPSGSGDAENPKPRLPGFFKPPRLPGKRR